MAAEAGVAAAGVATMEAGVAGVAMTKAAEAEAQADFAQCSFGCFPIPNHHHLDLRLN
jgi:hypothetical protein